MWKKDPKCIFGVGKEGLDVTYATKTDMYLELKKGLTVGETKIGQLQPQYGSPGFTPIHMNYSDIWGSLLLTFFITKTTYL